MRRQIGIAAGVAMVTIGAAGVVGAVPVPTGITERVCQGACGVSGPGWLGGSGQGNGRGNGAWGGQGSGLGTGPGHWWGAGPGSGMAPGPVGSADEHEALPPAPRAATLTGAMAEQLLHLAEEEKLAGDVYDLAAQRYDVRIFTNIGRSEDSHLSQVRALLDRYGLDDPTQDAPAGQFADEDLQALHDTLAAEVARGWDEAVAAGVLIEQTDIADLRDLLGEGGLPTDVRTVVEALQVGSQRHLAAFQRQS
jgi:hypothetical protein